VKGIVLIILLFFAVGLAMALLTRLTRMQQQLADLHKELKENDDKMARHRREVERMAAQHEADNQNRV
jgi:cell division protein FtsB